MRVLSVLAILVVAAKAETRNNVLSSSTGGSTGSYGSHRGASVQPYSGGGISSNNFVGEVFGGGRGRGSSGYGNNDVFSVDNVFGGNQLNSANALGGDIFGRGATFGNVAGNDGFSAAGGLQRGQVRTSILDQVGDRTDRRDDTFVRDSAQQEQSAARKDQQVRQGNYQENEQDRNQFQQEHRGQEKKDNYDQQTGRWNLDSRRQNDQETRRGSGIASDGEIARYDINSNDGAKALGVKKTAYTNGNLAHEIVGYKFDKDFDQVANERGGYKEITGRDNNNVQLYTEKQRDHRLSNNNNEAFRRADDLSRNAKSQEWLQNALQRQGQNQQYGNADRLQDANAKKAEDIKAFSDKRDDRIWNADKARDAAFRGAEDNASKNGLYNKDAIAHAAGAKGVHDSKYYDGTEYHPGGNRGGGGNVGYNTAGAADYAPRGGAGTGTGAGYNNRLGLQGGAAGNVAGLGAPNVGGKGRVENSGGVIVNGYRENAVTGDLANQISNNAAESRANAANQYLRDKGLQDSIQLDAANQGKWANQREGFRDARQQGYSGDNANAARAGEAVDNVYADSSSRSNLDAANRNFDHAKLDRINRKSNEVESTQNIRSKKQFYHDKNQGGFNNEGLDYQRNRGSNDFGAQEAAQKAARNQFSNLDQNNKNTLSQRRYEDYDGRRVSNGDAVYKQQNANKGNAEAFARASDHAKLNAQGFNRNKARQEFDSFNQKNNLQNQKLWDRANRDFNSRNSRNNIGRRTDAIFQYQNDGISNPNTGFRGQNPSYGGLGSNDFGRTPLNLADGFYDSSNSAFPYGSNAGRGQVQTAGTRNTGRNAGQTQFGKYW